jgi:hypothetical protein
MKVEYKVEKKSTVNELSLFEKKYTKQEIIITKKE